MSSYYNRVYVSCQLNTLVTHNVLVHVIYSGVSCQCSLLNCDIGVLD